MGQPERALLDRLTAEGRLALSGGRGIGPDVVAEALVSQQGFGVRYDLDPARAIITNRDHDLHGQSVAGKILVFTAPKGGVAASWALADLRERNLAPAGVIFHRAGPIFVQGAVFAGLPIMPDFSQPPTRVLTTGTRLLLQPSEGRVPYA